MGTYSENPPFDRRIASIPGVAANNPNSLGGSTLFRGRIETKDTVNGYFRRLNFLYNPSAIQWTGSVDSNTIGDTSVMDPNDASKFLMPMSQNVSFTLLFDRTYETWVYNAAKETSRLGVLADVKYFYAMLGILSDGRPFTPANNSTGAKMADSIAGTALQNSLAGIVDVTTIDDPSPTSFMQYIPVRVIFSSGALSYHGVINTATIDYTHFTQRMIPNRCALGIGMTLFPVAYAEVDAGDGVAQSGSHGLSPTVGTGRSGR